MLTEKRDSKNNTILSVEDLHGSATIIVSKKAAEEVALIATEKGGKSQGLT